MNFLSYVAQRVVTLIPTLIGLVILTFFLSRVVPADPAALIAGEGASRQQIEALRQRYGFDQPLLTQLGIYLAQLATGNLGTSIYTGRPVLTDLRERFPATLELTLAYPAFATIVRFTRSGVLDVMQRDFVLYEKAMGLPRLLITFKYLLRNALTSTVAQIGLLFGSLLAGAVVTEQVYDWPGLGLYAVESIMKFDYQAMLGITLWAGVAYSGVNLMVELAQASIDPRVVRR